MPSRAAIFTSHIHGEYMLRVISGMKDLVRVELIATDDPRRSYSNSHVRLWRYWPGGESDELRQLVPNLAAELGHSAFTGRVRPENGAFRRLFEEAKPELIITSVFGQLLPKWMLDAVEGRAWNLHNTIPGQPLAFTRGPQPIEKAYQVGSPTIEMCMHCMTEVLDEGEEVARSQPFPLPPIGDQLDAKRMLMIQKGTAPLGADLIKTHLLRLLG